MSLAVQDFGGTFGLARSQKLVVSSWISTSYNRLSATENRPATNAATDFPL